MTEFRLEILRHSRTVSKVTRELLFLFCRTIYISCSHVCAVDIQGFTWLSLVMTVIVGLMTTVYDAIGPTPGRQGDACMSVSQSPVFITFPFLYFQDTVRLHRG